MKIGQASLGLGVCRRFIQQVNVGEGWDDQAPKYQPKIRASWEKGYSKCQCLDHTLGDSDPTGLGRVQTSAFYMKTSPKI